MQFQKPGGFQVLPEVVKNLLILNGLFFLATEVLGGSFGIDLTGSLGLHIIGSDYFRPYQFVSHLFMHGGFWHLFSNMFALWMFGSSLENVWGAKKMLTYYLITGLGAALLHSAVTGYGVYTLQVAVEQYSAAPSADSFASFLKGNMPSSYYKYYIDYINEWLNSPYKERYASKSIDIVNGFLAAKSNVTTVGASGAVFGILLAFGMLFPNQLIYISLIFPVKAKYFVAFYGIYELYSGLSGFEGDNIAHFAHLGGMIFGYFLIRYWQKSNNSSFF